MYNIYIVLCLSVSFSVVLSDLDKEEGADCEWEGFKGKCVPETTCLTTLDKRGLVPPVCSKHGEINIICCTDCELVNDTRNVVISPSHMFWKDGSPSRDHCLEYLDTLPYRCREGGFYGGLSRYLEEGDNCHKYSLWGVGGAPPPGYEPGADYPYQVLLGFGETLETAKWITGGSIITNRYILTSGSAVKSHDYGTVKFVAMDVKNRSDPSSWQTFKVLRTVLHPEYKETLKYHDIALIETETPITFDKDVLPACLHVEDPEDDQAIVTTWNDLKKDITDPPALAETIQTINVEKYSNEECKAAYEGDKRLSHGVDLTTQMCYGSKETPTQACRGTVGELLLFEEKFARCVPSIIGVTSFTKTDCNSQATAPTVYTRIQHYVPWIASIVWP